MKYQSDIKFANARDLIDFFLRDERFRTRDRYSANSTGQNWNVFRGHSNADWSLLASAFRDGSLDQFTPQPPAQVFTVDGRRRHMGNQLHAEARALYIFMESADAVGLSTPLDYTATDQGLELIRAALNDDEHYDYREAFPGQSFHRATAFAQHYGVPTRFLDWSESALVASYFAAYGASCFSDNPPEEGQELSIIFMQTSPRFTDDDFPIELIKAPRHENSHLERQKGVFTSIKHANAYFLQNGHWPSVCEYQQLALSRVRLCASHANDLLRELFDLGVSRHTLMPTLHSAAQSYDYTKRLFG